MTARNRSNQDTSWTRRLAGGLWYGAIATIAIATGGLAQAQMPVSLSPDTTVTLGTANVVVHDEDVVIDNQLGLMIPLDIGNLQGGVEVIAYGQGVRGLGLIAFDSTVDLGGVVARPGDVVGYDGSRYSLLFDATSSGVPVGTHTDATSLSPDGLLLSFDTDVDLAGVFVADEDLVSWDGSTFSPVFSGASAGLGREHDIDAAQDLGGGAFLVSLETSGSVGGVVFADEDVLRFDNGTWSIEFDGSEADPDWGPADLQAVQVPEPAVLTALAAGIFLLSALSRPRLQRSFGTRRIPAGSLLALSLGLFVTLFGGQAIADDGQWEINQTCAVQTGCFPGDAPGFPITINEPGSYLLTSILTAPPNSAAILPSTGDFSLDLGGFEMVGPVNCTGTGSAVSCDSDVGSGLAAGDDANVQVFNGHVRGFGFIGIAVGDGGHVHHVTADANSLRGISTGARSRVHDVSVTRNQGAGILVGPYSIVEHVFSKWNSVDGIFADTGSTVTSSLFTANGDDGIDTGTGCVISGNHVTNNGFTGIEAGAGSTVTNNISAGNTFAGVRADPGVAIRGNLIRDNGGVGINFVGGAGSSYRANDLTNNTDGPTLGPALDLGNNNF